MLYNRNNLAVVECASSDEMRPILTGVKFEGDKTIATDGYVLMSCTCPVDISSSDLPSNGLSVKSGDYSVVVDRNVVKKVASELPKNPSLPILGHAFFTDTSDSEVTDLVTNDLTTFTKHSTHAIEGEYPEYKSLFPSCEGAFSINVSVKRLKQVINGLSKMELHDSASTIRLTICPPEAGMQNSLKPLRIETETAQGQEVRAIIMPVRMMEE